MTMQGGPNDRIESDAQPQPDAPDGVRADAARADDQPSSASNHSRRWVQLAYDLEQHGEGDSESRGEVF